MTGIALGRPYGREECLAPRRPPALPFSSGFLSLPHPSLHAVPVLARMPTLKRYILDRSEHGSEAFGLVMQLKGALLPDESRKLDLALVAVQLEEALKSREAVLREVAAQPQATASTIVSSLLRERAAVLETVGRSGRRPEDGGSAEGGVPDALASEAAFVKSGEFRALCQTIESLDLSTLDGLRLALDAGFDGHCVVAVRTLCATSRGPDPIVRGHRILRMLNDIRSARVDYFNYVLRIDQVSGVVEPAMLEYSFASGQDSITLNQFLQFDFHLMDWYAAPNGLQGYRQRLNGWMSPMQTHKLDYYIQPDLLRELGAFGQRLFIALGCTVESTAEGYDFAGLCGFFADHLNLARRLCTLDEKYTWLENAQKQFTAALAYISTSIRQKVYSSEPASVSLSRLLVPVTAECIQTCLAAQSEVKTLTAHRQKWQHIFNVSSSSMAPVSDILPLLSDRAAASRGVKRTPGVVAPSGGNKAPKKETTPHAQQSSSPNAAAAERGLPPGSLVASWSWANGGKYLLISGRVWNVESLAKYLGVQRSSVCWPFILAGGRDYNRPARCDMWGKPGHKSASDTAHHLKNHPRGLDLAALATRFARPATKQDKDNAGVKRVHPSKPPNRNRTKHRIRGGHDDSIEVSSDSDELVWNQRGGETSSCVNAPNPAEMQWESASQGNEPPTSC